MGRYSYRESHLKVGRYNYIAIGSHLKVGRYIDL